MSKYEAFLKPTTPDEIRDVVVSKRFTDTGKPDGKPVPWKIKAISQDENDLLIKKHTQSKFMKGQWIDKLNKTEYQRDLIDNCVVFPDLHDAELLKAWGTNDPTELASIMLYTGEYLKLVNAISDLCGFDENVEDMLDDAKN